VLLGVREGCRYRGVDYELQLDSDRRRVRAFLIAFANGREYGNGARIAPQAELDDGLLDATIVEDRPVPVRFWHARHLATGTAHRASSVTVRQIVRASVEADGPIEFHVDGEPAVADGRVEISIVPRALNVRVAR
jgi:diacylglycerol kinase (ATP)